jgi:hypothetical protein
MTSIRIRITIDLNQNHALAAGDLKALKPLIERSVAAALPGCIAVDTISVTSIKETAAKG